MSQVPGHEHPGTPRPDDMPGPTPVGVPGFEQPLPGYGQPTPENGPPGFGYGAPQYPPGYGPNAGYGQPPAGGYGPSPYLAPRPGIVPLRPLTLGDIFDGMFRAARANPGVMFGFTAVIVGITTTISSILSYGYLSTALASIEDPYAVDPTGLLGSGVEMLIGSMVTTLATTLLTGFLTIAVSRAVIGQRISLAETWRQAKGQVLRLIGTTLLIGLMSLLVVAVGTGVVVGAIMLFDDGQTSGVAVGVVLMLLAVLTVIAGVGFISVKTMFATPVVMLERLGAVDSIKRAWTLTKGRFWRTLGIYLLISIVLYLISSIISGAIGVVAGVALIASPDSGGVFFVAATAVASFIASLITQPFLASGQALLYIDARMRSEGLDAELAKAAEDAYRQAHSG